MKQLIGSWAFLIGVILAVIFGVIPTVQNSEWAVIILFVLGIVIGLLNITAKETQSFLMAGTVLVIVSYFGGEGTNVVSWIGGIFSAMNLLFVPATIVVALKSVFGMAKK